MSENTQVTVGELIALYLENYGIEAAFGVISIHNMPILDAIGRRGNIRFVPSRGEAGAVNMADAYARVQGDLGVAVTSTGTGAGNGAGALVEAETAGTPLLHLTGQIDSPYVDKGWNYIHEAKDQPGMLSAICKSYYRISDPAETVNVLNQALSDALTAPRGPVSVEIPADIQSTLTDIPADLSPPAVTALTGDQTAVDRLVAAFEKAKRPMLWLGGGAKHASAEVQRLADMGIGIVTSVNGRGVIAEDHPLSMGAYGATASAADLYATLDLMLVAGSSLRGNETRNYGLKLPDNLYRIDADPTAFEKCYPSATFVNGDSREILTILADRLDGKIQIDNSLAHDIGAAKAKSVDQLRDGVQPYTGIIDELQSAMPDDAIWVRDITVANSTWGNRLVNIGGPRNSVHALGGGIGQGLAMAIGAAVGAGGRKTIALSGDGGFLLNIGELATAVQEKADITIILMNDQGYGVIRNIQDAKFEGRHYFANILLPDFSQIAGAVGAAHWKVTSEADFKSVIEEAVAVPGPAIVEIDMVAIGPYKVAFGGPPIVEAKNA